MTPNNENDKPAIDSNNSKHPQTWEGEDMDMYNAVIDRLRKDIYKIKGLNLTTVYVEIDKCLLDIDKKEGWETEFWQPPFIATINVLLITLEETLKRAPDNHKGIYISIFLEQLEGFYKMFSNEKKLKENKKYLKHIKQ